MCTEFPRYIFEHLIIFIKMFVEQKTSIFNIIPVLSRYKYYTYYFIYILLYINIYTYIFAKRLLIKREILSFYSFDNTEDYSCVLFINISFSQLSCFRCFFVLFLAESFPPGKKSKEGKSIAIKKYRVWKRFVARSLMSVVTFEL